jgi:tetratricopeptide (TPR) repeat protein
LFKVVAVWGPNFRRYFSTIINSSTHQLINSSTHQLINSSTPFLQPSLLHKALSLSVMEPDPDKELAALTDALSLSFVPLRDANADDERFLLSQSDRIDAYAALGRICHARYRLNDVSDDFNSSVTMYQKAEALMTEGDERHRTLLLCLSKVFLLRSECTASLGPLRSASNYAVKAWNLTADDPKAIAELLDYIGRRVFRQYYLLTRETSHLNDAISNIETALDLDDKLTYWDDYSTLLLKRFSKTRSVPDLDDAIKVSERCVSSTEVADSSTQALLRLHLAKGLMYRYELTNSLPDINRAIDVAREAVQLLEPFKRIEAIKSRGEQAYREFDRSAQYLLLLFMALNHRFRKVFSRKDAAEAMQIGDAVLKTADKFPTARISITSDFETLTSLLGTLLGTTRPVRPQMLEPVSGDRPEVNELDPNPEPHSSSPEVRGEQLLILGNQSTALWNESGDQAHLDKAISLYKQAFQLNYHDHLVDRYIFLIRLLNTRFVKSSSPTDHEDAVTYAEKLFKLVSKTDPTYLSCLVLLGTTLRLSPDFEPVSRAIDVLYQALEIIPKGSVVERQECAFNLSLAMYVQFERSGIPWYLDRQIDLERETIPLLLSRNVTETVRHLRALSYALTSRYMLDGKQQDLDEAIQAVNQALELSEHDLFNQSMLNDSLGCCYYRSYCVTGSLHHLRQSISLFQMTLSMTPAIAPSARPIRRYRKLHLVYTLQELFFHTGSLDNLEVALNHCKDWISETTDSAISQSDVLKMALSVLVCRAKFEGSTSEWEHLSKVDPPGHLRHVFPTYRDRGGLLETVVSMFQSISGLLDLMAKKIVKEFGPQHCHDLQLSRQTDSWALGEKSEEGIIQYLERDIQLQGKYKSLIQTLLACWKQLLEITESRAAGQTEPSLWLPFREGLGQVIEVCKEALEDSDRGLFHSRFTSTLSKLLLIRFTLTKSLDDLNELIEQEEKLLELSRVKHRERGKVLQVLSDYLLARFNCQSQPELSTDFERSIQMKEEAANNVSLNPRQRFAVAVRASELCFGKQPRDLKRAKDILGVAIKIMPMIAVRHLSQRDLQRNVSNFGIFISMAVSLALEFGEEPVQCLRLLESGRGLIAGMHLDLRDGGSHLAALPENLAGELVQLRQKLNSPFSDCQSLDLPTSDVEVLASPSRLFSVLEDRRKLSAEFSNHLQTILRTYPGFESFLTGLSESEMKSLAAQGPIVIFNTSNLRSDAFIITPLKIWSIPLSKLTFREAVSQADKLLKAVEKVQLRNIKSSPSSCA